MAGYCNRISQCYNRPSLSMQGSRYEAVIDDVFPFSTRRVITIIIVLGRVKVMPREFLHPRNLQQYASSK